MKMDMNSPDVKRKLTAIFSADAEGCSRLMGEDEVSAIRTLQNYKEIMASLTDLPLRREEQRSLPAIATRPLHLARVAGVGR